MRRLVVDARLDELVVQPGDAHQGATDLLEVRRSGLEHGRLMPLKDALSVEQHQEIGESAPELRVLIQDPVYGRRIRHRRCLAAFLSRPGSLRLAETANPRPLLKVHPPRRIITAQVRLGMLTVRIANRYLRGPLLNAHDAAS